MPKRVPPPRGLALICLREAAGWSQRELAAAGGFSSALLSQYESGAKPMERERLRRLAGLMGYGDPDIDFALLAAAALIGRDRPKATTDAAKRAPGTADEFPAAAQMDASGASARGGDAGAVKVGAAAAGAASLSPGEPTEFERRLAREAAARLGLTVAELGMPLLLKQLRCRRIAEERATAVRLWKDLQAFDREERRAIVERLPQFQTWALAELLATESAGAAARSAELALELVRLAERVASLADLPTGWRSRLQGFVRAFLANALRVAGKLREALAEIEAAWRLWREGSDPEGILPEWRLLDLEASLRRDRREFGVALDLLRRARAAAPPEALGRILSSLGVTLEQAGDVVSAVVALREAAPLLGKSGTQRERFGVVFNLTVNLCHLERFQEAQEELPGLRHMAQALGNELDLLKVQWLSGRASAGLDQREEARRTFERVRASFAAGRHGLLTAVVSLELAVLYLEEGRTAEVRELAAEMAATFATQGINREALASLQLFYRAARQERATLHQVRHLLTLLEDNPRLGLRTVV
jgi:transcriptional regulator with XRE-family HTH domain/tetratricopeptide (TPR) repeat protein